jgi:hypothetical protein
VREVVDLAVCACASVWILTDEFAFPVLKLAARERV